MLDDDDNDFAGAPDNAGDNAAPNAPGSGPSDDDPWGLNGLTDADLPTYPGDGVFTPVMRHMAAMGHPQLQAWAAKDAAQRANGYPTPAGWNWDGAAQPLGSGQISDLTPVNNNGSIGMDDAKPIEIADSSAAPQPLPPSPSQAPSYKLVPGINISDSLGAKAEPIAAAVRDVTGRPMTITSTVRSPSGQAAAMYNNLEKGTPASYANKAAAQQITNAYNQAKAAGKSPADTISAMQSQIDQQVSQGTYVSKHMLDGAFDVRVKDYQNRMDPIMRAAVVEAAKAHGAMVYPEADHLHIQPR